MSTIVLSPSNDRPRLKEATGWFAAGQSFRRAMELLSDGAFKLFAHICLQADRRTGRFSAGHKELAASLGKSKRIISNYVGELESKGICAVSSARNQHARTTFQVCDAFWPYHRVERPEESPEQKTYVESVREYFLALGCGSGDFGAGEAETARDMQRRGIPLGVIEQAMLMGGCRKYGAWLEGRALEPIRNLRYFQSLIEEIQEKPLPPGYTTYLRRKIKQLTEMWINAPRQHSQDQSQNNPRSSSGTPTEATGG